MAVSLGLPFLRHELSSTPQTIYDLIRKSLFNIRLEIRVVLYIMNKVESFHVFSLIMPGTQARSIPLLVSVEMTIRALCLSIAICINI